MRIRSAAAVAAVAVMGLGLVACSSPAAEDSNSQVLTVTAVTNEKPALDVVVPMFEKANPGITVKVETSALDQYQPAIRTQLSSGTAPDVIGVWPGSGNPAAMQTLVPGGFLADLSDIDRVDEFPEGVKSVSQIDGKTYVAPIAFSGIGPIYNMTAMTEAGFSVPTTWSELKQFCTDATAQTGKPAFYLGAQTNWNTQLITYALLPSLVYGPNPDFAQEMSDGKQTFAGSGWQQAMDQYMELVDHGCFQADPLGVSYEASVTALAKGDTFGATFVTSGFAALRAEAPEGTEFSMEALPATDNAEDTRMPGAAGSTWAINAKAKNPELAKKFLQFLMSEEGMNAYAEANGTLPAIPSGELSDPALETLQRFQSENKTDPWMDQLWPNARVQATHFEAVQNMLSGAATAEEGLKAMDAAYAQGE